MQTPPPWSFGRRHDEGAGSFAVSVAALAAACPDLTPGYTKIPNMLFDAGLTPRQFQMLALILSYRWQGGAAYPRIRTLSARLDCSDRTIQRAIRGLEERGYLVVEERFRSSDDSQTSNVYHPGPRLLPFLPPTDDLPATGSAGTHRSPVTSRSGLQDQHPGKKYATKKMAYRPGGIARHYLGAAFGQVNVHAPGGG
jgi:hypothetical protein